MEIDDDHYFPDLNNAHLKLDRFKKKLGEIAKSRSAYESEDQVLQKICDHTILCINKEPEEPSSDHLICRYLTPLKYLWFVSSKALRFANAGQFEDPRECSLPDDYDNAVSSVLNKYNLSYNQWQNQLRKKKEEWLISCWTTIDNHNDDYLIWHKYAGGPTGIGITIQYGKLKEHLQRYVDQTAENDSFICGKVGYMSPFRTLPCNKREMFRNEKEVRFAFRHPPFLDGHEIDVGDIFQDFGLRFSQDVSEHHFEAVRNLWIGCGGQDRFQRPVA